MASQSFLCLICKKKNEPVLFRKAASMKQHFLQAHTDIPKSEWSNNLAQNRRVQMPLVTDKIQPIQVKSEIKARKKKENAEASKDATPSKAQVPSPAPVEVELELVEAWEAIRQLLGRKEDNEKDLKRELSEKQVQLQTLKNERKCLKANLGAARDQLVEAKVDKAMYQEEFERLQAQLAEQKQKRQEDIERLQTELQQEKQKYQDDMKRAEDENRSALAKAQQQIKKEPHEGLHEQLQLLQDQLHEQKREHQKDWDHAISEQRVKVIKLAQAQDHIQTLESSLERSQERCKRKDEELERVQGENDMLRKQLKTIVVNVAKVGDKL